jgi:hypothetical protein
MSAQVALRAAGAARYRASSAAIIVFEALLRRRVCSAQPPLPVVAHPILPWALFPFKVPISPRPAAQMGRIALLEGDSQCTQHTG